MEEAPLESLLRQPLKLIEDIKFAAREVDSYKQECVELLSRVETLTNALRTIVRMVRQGNPRFCESPTHRIVDETSNTLESCFFLLRKCKKTGILRRVIIIISATEFRRAHLSLDDAIANINWLLESATDEEPVSVMGMPPITSSSPNLAVIWSLLSKLQGGTPSLKEGAASHLASMALASEQNGQFLIEEGGIPLLLRVLLDGTNDGKIMAAMALGNLATSQDRVRQMVRYDALPACVHALEKSTMQVQAKVAWAMAELVLRDPEAQKELGKAGAIKHLVALMLETMNDKHFVPPAKAASLHALVMAGSLGSLGESSNTHLGSNEMTRMPDGGGLKDNAKHHWSTSDSLYHGSTSRDTPLRGRERSSEVKNDLKVQVTRTLWFLASQNLDNSRRIAETRAMLGFAKLIESEQGEAQKNAVMALMELAAVAEADADFRKFAFKLTSPAAKAVVDQLLRLAVDDRSAEAHIRVFCVRALGSLAKAFSAKNTEVVKALVSDLIISDSKRHLPIAREALYSLLKFTDDKNFLRQEHSLTIVEVPGLPYLVQLVALDTENGVQVPAIVLLSQLALLVGRTKYEAFQEAAAVSVLKSVADSVSKFKQFTDVPIEDHIFQAIYHLQFCQAGGTVNIV